MTKKQEFKVREYVRQTGKICKKWTDEEKEFGEKLQAKNVCKKFVNYAVLHPEITVKECLYTICKEEDFPVSTFKKYYEIL